MAVKPGEDGFKDAVIDAVGEFDYSGVVSGELHDDGIEEGHDEEHVDGLVASMAVSTDVVANKVSRTE